MARVACRELLELVHSLRQEQLFVSAEKRKILALNDEVRRCSDRLFERAWTTRHQRVNLDRYILSLQDILSAHRKALQLDNVHFVDSYKWLGNADPPVCELIKALRENPKLLALFLDRCEQVKISASILQSLICAVMISLYGACLLPEDNNYALVLLYELMHLQLPRTEQLRRLLQYGSCAFSRCYKAFVEAHLPAKLFLTSALRNAIIQVLVNDDLYLDIEPNDAAARFVPEERVRHFGSEGTPQYESTLRTYRLWSIRKLTGLVQLFLDGISESMFCFPPALAWLVRQFYGIILDENKIEPRQIAVICADLVFYFFICPAICNPELYGVIEEGLHIGQCARFNLMQVARIIQALSMARYEPIDTRLEEVYRHFDKELLPNILEEIIRGNQQPDLLSDLLNGSAVTTDPSTSSQDNGPLTRNAVLISPAELHYLVSTVHQILDLESDGSLLHEWLQPLMEHVPTELPLNTHGMNNLNGHSSEDGTLKTALMTKVNKMRNSGGRNLHHGGNLDSSVETVDELLANHAGAIITEVLVVPLPSSGRREFPGAMPEEKVLTLEQNKRSATKVRLNLDNLEEKSSTGSGKRTRFFGDQESIAGASDNMEAGLSEAASVASSLDLEENADNLSDMVSANVSGPGTPSVSGRDTPSSHGAAPVPPHPAQIAEQLQMLQGGANQPEQPQLPAQAQLPPPANIPSRRRGPPRPEAQKQMDIEDRFGRFGISNGSAMGSSVVEEETKSMVSDTWSTDVLGSDSEAHYGSGAAGVAASAQEQQLHIESHLNAMQQHIHGHLSQHNVHVLQQQQQQQLIEFSETQSDAWSTAAMTSYSDLDRLQEVDPEDDLMMLMPSERRRSAEDVGAAMDVGAGEAAGGVGGAAMFAGRGMASVNGRQNPDRQSTPTNLIKLNSVENNEPPPLIDIGDGGPSIRMRGGNLQQQAISGASADTPLVEIDPPQQEEMLPGAFAHSLSNGSVSSFGSSTPFASVIECAGQGSQSLGRLSFAMKEHSPSRENLLERDLTQFSNGSIVDNARNSGATAAGVVKPQGSADSSDGNSESSSDLLAGVVAAGSGGVAGRSSCPGSAGDDSERQVQMRSGAIPKTPRIHLQQQQSSGPGDRTSGGSSNGRHSRQSGSGAQRGFLRKIGTIRQSISSRVKTLDRNSVSRRGLATPDGENGSGVHDETGALGGAGHQIVGTLSTPTVQFMDPSEILEKYRGKNRGDAEALASGLMADNASSVSGGDLIELDESEASELSPEEVAFLDAKRKLRTVFATANTQTLHLDRSRIELLLLLKMMLAESIGLQNHQLTAQLHEAIRCVSKLDASMQERVLYAMREDYRQRSAYISYLVRARQGLETTLAGLQTLLAHVKKDKNVSHGYLTTQCVLEFLQIIRRKDVSLNLDGLVAEFKDLDVSDEKAVLVEKYLERVFKEMGSHALWYGSSEEYLALSESTVERLIMGKLYVHALFPNGDIDLHRDQVLTVHIKKLAQIITPQHRALRIPRGYLLECPWPSAQAAIATLNAYKAPRDKLSCVFLCCKTILDLLHLASNSAAAADDLFPILVYVLIQANPQYLLSNIEYVKHFCPGYQEGEAGYYWTMLDSAVVFIKSLEYN